jgi:hypothetical protein
MKNNKSEKNNDKKPAVISPVSIGSRFGGAKTNIKIGVGHSQYKPAPVKITQHKG